MEFEKFSKELKEYTKQLSLNLSDNKIKQFFDYMMLLIEWNKKINLTAIVEEKEIIIKHFVDSLTIANQIEHNSLIIDVGTGAGFPGIPLKIYDDSLNITLLDSLNKRAIFLNDVIEKLKLKNINVVHGRAEDYAQEQVYRARYDYAVSRAVAPLNILLEYLVPFVKVNGKVIAMKGSNAEEEIGVSKKALGVLNSKIVSNKKVDLPEHCGERYILTVLKEQSTPTKYPRQAGIPKKKPL